MRVDRSIDDARLLEVVHDRGRRPGHDLEGGGYVRHPHRAPGGHEIANDSRLAPGQSHRAKLGHGAALETSRGPHQKLGQLSRVPEARRGVGPFVGRLGHRTISEHASI